MASTSKERFDKNFWYIVGTTGVVFVYIFCITFCNIPKKSIRYVDITLSFLFGSVLSAGLGYLLGGTAKKDEKQPTTPGTNE